jgi:ethanolamine transporter EutH
MFIALILLCILVPFIFICLAMKYPNDELFEGVSIFSTLVFGFILFGCVAGIFTTISSHAKDLGVLQEWNPIVAHYEQRVEELKQSVGEIAPTIKQENVVLMTADTPVASLILALNEAQQQLLGARTKTQEARVRIAQRKAGVMWFVVSIYGDPL